MLGKLRTFRGLKKKNVHARDGERMGRICDLLFDDHTWTIRYLIVELRHWYEFDRVLISPLAVDESAWTDKYLRLTLTEEAIQNSPSWCGAREISNEFEKDYYDRHDWPYYWAANGLWGKWSTPFELVSGRDESAQTSSNPFAEGDRTLRSCQSMFGFDLQTVDGRPGSLEDFLIDDRSWAIRYFSMSTRRWWPGKRHIVAPDWISQLDSHNRCIRMELPSQAILNSPVYHPKLSVTPSFENSLYDYYHRRGYWLLESRSAAA